MKSWGVVRFLGSNCDRDLIYSAEELGYSVEFLDYSKPIRLQSELSLIILPGGFSYGDYLRAGALAAKTPAAQSLVRIAEAGVPVLGICNGFQILCELGLLPGALVPNLNRRFVNEFLELSHSAGRRFYMPVAHACGRYFKSQGFADHNAEVWLKYVENPNDSEDDIAGLKKANVFGLMPHPERSALKFHPSQDGLEIFREVLQS